MAHLRLRRPARSSRTASGDLRPRHARPAIESWRRTWCAVALAIVCGALGACAPHTLYNDEPHEYLTTARVEGHPGASVDLAIIEVDDHGAFWDVRQLEDAIELIRRRNDEAHRGVAVVIFVHGWKNNARPDGRYVTIFRDRLTTLAARQLDDGAPFPDHVVGVYIGWRGATSTVPIHENTTFWDRQRAAERLVSYNMRETFFRLTHATREREDSTCVVMGHSMGGLIVGRTLGPAISTLLLAAGAEGVRVVPDMVVLENSSLNGLAAHQLIDYLKRANARLKLKADDGSIRDAPGPLILSIASEGDTAMRVVYPIGQAVESLGRAFRPDTDPPRPSQRYLATHGEGQIDFLVSHHARVEDGELVFERVPDAYNDTPYWIVRVTEEISADHSDVSNPLYRELTTRILRLNRLYDTRSQTWLYSDPEAPLDLP